MESLTKLNFDHSQENISCAVGLAEGEGEAIHHRVVELLEETPTVSQTLEKILKEFKGSHLLFAIWHYGTLVGQMSNPFARLAGLFGGDE